MFEIRIGSSTAHIQNKILKKNNWKINMVCSKSELVVLKQERLFRNSKMMFGNRKRMLKNKSE